MTLPTIATPSPTIALLVAVVILLFLIFITLPKQGLREKLERDCEKFSQKKCVEDGFALFKDAAEKILAKLYDMQEELKKANAIREKWDKKLTELENERICKKIEDGLKEQEERQ